MLLLLLQGRRLHRPVTVQWLFASPGQLAGLQAALVAGGLDPAQLGPAPNGQKKGNRKGGKKENMVRLTYTLGKVVQTDVVYCVWPPAHVEEGRGLEPWQEAHMAMAEKHRPSQGTRYVRVAKEDLASVILAGDCV